MDDETLFRLLVDLHRDGARQGPGSEAETRRALDLTRLDKAAALQVADIGCGTGAATLVLAQALPHAAIAAVDLSSVFLETLMQRAEAAGCTAQIAPHEMSMDALAFAPESLDLIWAEGAIYNIGFRAGLHAWRPFLRPGGVVAVSEITWLRPDPPAEVRDYWMDAYPEIATASEKIAILEAAGYDLRGYFVLSPSSWLQGYYTPLKERLPAFQTRHDNAPEAGAVAAMERKEAALYMRYQDWFSYGFYVARAR